MTLRLTMLFATITVLMSVFGARALLRSDLEPTAIASPTVNTAASRITKLEEQVRKSPDDVDLLTNLAEAYAQGARETGDPSYYTREDTAVRRALSLEPGNVRALIVAGGLALARHDFQAALELGERARDIEPTIAASYGVITDANVELGRYAQAIVAAQAMADRRPDFASYSRISYIRELHGDIDGAIVAMEQAVAAGSSLTRDLVWGRVLLGNLRLQKGDVDGAASEYTRASTLLPADPNALFGLARLAIARGDPAEAETRLKAASARRPQAEYVIALGDLLSTQGRTREADLQYDTVRAIQQLFVANGGDADLELTLFDADQGVDPEATYARAAAAYERRSSVYGADTVAWAAYKAGRIDDAQRYMALAQRLGTRDPRLDYHAGVIARAAGDIAAAAEYLRDAVALAPALSPTYASDAVIVLGEVEAEVTR